MGNGEIVVSGAREHNLKNIEVTIPRGSLTVITGISGSGKSSLAFDTLYAEGQRRYVESLSAYARQFLNQMQKPDVDFIDGLSPAIAIEQRTAGSNPRSIVATATEVHDYLRLLFGHLGQPHCPRCAREVSPQSPQQIVEHLLQLPNRARLSLLAPLVSGQKGPHADLIASLRKQGFLRIRIDGEICEIEAAPELRKRELHTIDVVVDRLLVTTKVRSRLTDSVELALKHGDGKMIAVVQETGTDARDVVYSEHNACAECGISFPVLQPRHFSFNSPYGACQKCSGLGTYLVFDPDLIIPDTTVSIKDGAIHAWRRGGRRLIVYYNGLLRSLAKHYKFSLEEPYEKLTESLRDMIWNGSGDEEVEFGYWRGGGHKKYKKPFEGVWPNLLRRYEETKSEYTRQRLRGYMTRRPCPDCEGKRLKPEILACTVSGKSIVDVTGMTISDAHRFFTSLDLTDTEQHIAGEVVREITKRLRFMSDIGLGYLTLNRESGTLSGGEAQRIRLATQIGAGLVGVLYVLDEPSIGLHQRDNARLIDTLKQLRDTGNTVVVVEHDAETIRSADYVVDLGPGAGHLGGEVIAQGTVAELLKCRRSLTAQYMNRKVAIQTPTRRRKPSAGALKILGAAANNLKNINVSIPLGVFVCITGVSGSGKSTLVDDILRNVIFRELYRSRALPGKHDRIEGLDEIDKAIVIDQSPIGRTPRSNPATYTGAFTHIRKLMADLPASKVRGYGAGRYSFNVKGGRCETCRGDGTIRLEMHFLPDVFVPCEVCRGSRYNEETLTVQYNGCNISQILNMTIDEALSFFENIPAIATRLKTLSEVGLGYLQLGQSATTLSGGEAQRIKLSAELAKKATGNTLYMLDEPTTGLHFADVDRLLLVLNRLCDAGNTVLVIEHNLDVIKSADYIIDLGPEGGDGGGQIVAKGTPEKIAECKESYTGRFLKQAL